MAFEPENPQHDLHVSDWAWAQAVGKRPIFMSANEVAAYVEGRFEDRYDRSDLYRRNNWDLP